MPNVLADDQDVRQGGRAGQEFFRHLLVVEAPQHVRHGQGAGPAVLAQVGQLVPAVRGQRHHRDDPGAQAGQGEHDERPAVRQLDHDPHPGPQPEPGQPGGQRVGPGQQRRVADPGGAVDQGRRVRPGGGDRGDLGPEIPAAPPAGLRVLAGQVVRPRHGSLKHSHRTSLVRRRGRPGPHG